VRADPESARHTGVQSSPCRRPSGPDQALRQLPELSGGQRDPQMPLGAVALFAPAALGGASPERPGGGEGGLERGDPIPLAAGWLDLGRENAAAFASAPANATARACSGSVAWPRRSGRHDPHASRSGSAQGSGESAGVCRLTPAAGPDPRRLLWIGAAVALLAWCRPALGNGPAVCAGKQQRVSNDLAQLQPVRAEVEQTGATAHREEGGNRRHRQANCGSWQGPLVTCVRQPAA